MPWLGFSFFTGVVHGFLKAEWQYEDFEELLALYEKLRDQAVALGWKEDRALAQAGVPELVIATA